MELVESLHPMVEVELKIQKHENNNINFRSNAA